jgi:hypothetical protein
VQVKFILFFLLFTFVGLSIFSDIYSATAFSLTISLVLRLILLSNESFVFREWALLLYAINYLLSPAITYHLGSMQIANPMKISAESYFLLAIPGFLLFMLGMFSISTKIFQPNFNKIRNASLINERFLFQMTLFGIGCKVASNVFSTDLAFFMYLLSLLRFVGVFSLYSSNSTKYKYLMVFVLIFELYNGFKNAMFHDAIMWLIFFGLFYLYVNKPNFIFKLGGSVILIVVVLLIQSFKGEYRDRVWRGGESADIETISDVGLGKANKEQLIGEDNLLGTLNRGNQAWIFASTVDNLDRTLDFQGMNNVNLYIESALLPRFLAPNKITSGNRLIFNRFSGHYIGEGTAMGLGVFADGYIAYGQWGVYFFTFILGLIFSLTFKLVEGWSKISPFYILLILPMLNYAVRPDCELQTIINHLAKSIVVFGGLVYVTKYRFTMDSINVNKQ